MIYVYLAEGFEETEMIFPLDLMRRAGLDVKTVSITGERVVTGSHGIPVVADATVCDADYRPDEAEMLMLPGGMPGTKNLAASKAVSDALDKAFADGRYLAAICAAPSVLGEKGFLAGKKAVCYPGFEGSLHGRTVTDERCVRDGNVITAVGAGAACEFGLEIVAALVGNDVADKLKKGILAVTPD